MASLLKVRRIDLPLSSVASGGISARRSVQGVTYSWFPFWATIAPSSAGSGDSNISGAVTDAGNPVSRCVVRLYYRPTGALIRSALTDTGGLFSFAGLNPTETQNYFAVAFDPEGGVQYNAIVFDRLSAV